MNTAQFSHSSSVQPDTSNDDFIVDPICLSTIESEKRQMQYGGNGYIPQVMSDDIIDLEQLTTLLKFLRKTNEPIFQVSSHSYRFRITPRVGWEVMMRGSPANLFNLFHDSARFSIHPYLWHFLNNFGDLDMTALKKECFSDQDEAARLAGYLNDRVNILRTDLRSHHTARSVENHRRGYRSNLASLSGYVSDLFKRYSRLLVVRLDLGYKQGLSLNPLMAQYHVVVSTQPEYGISSPHEPSLPPSPRVTIGQIQQHREALLAFIRNTFGHKFCGYAWKLEYGARKGYHFHVVLFFNGAHLCRDVAIGTLIGDHWNSVITAGQGNYYNCNANGHRYRHPCIGNLSWNSPALQQGMDYLCAYLMKPDLYARLELGPGQRTFGRGVSPLRGWADQPRRGRPRSM